MGCWGGCFLQHHCGNIIDDEYSIFKSIATDGIVGFGLRCMGLVGLWPFETPSEV